MKPGWLTTAQVADMVGRRPRTVISWVKAGKLKHAGNLPDGAYLFDPQTVEDFVRFGVSQPVRHATMDPATVRAFVDAAYRRTVAAKRGSA